jgi:hypothetical protein
MPAPTHVFGRRQPRQPGCLYAFIAYHWGVLKYDILTTFVGSFFGAPKIPFRPGMQFLCVQNED